MGAAVAGAAPTAPPGGPAAPMADRALLVATEDEGLDLPPSSSLSSSAGSMLNIRFLNCNNIQYSPCYIDVPIRLGGGEEVGNTMVLCSNFPTG